MARGFKQGSSPCRGLCVPQKAFVQEATHPKSVEMCTAVSGWQDGTGRSRVFYTKLYSEPKSKLHNAASVALHLVYKYSFEVIHRPE